MKKQTALLLSFILLALTAAFLLVRPLFGRTVSFSVGDGQEVAALKADYREAETPFFTELAFSGEQLPYDRETSTFYLPLNPDDREWESGALTSLSPEVKLLFEEDFTAVSKQEAIAEGRAFRFYAIRGEEYQICSLVCTGLPVISIETGETAETEVFGGSVYFWDNSTKVNWTSSSILEAHIRGNTSRTYPKKGYKLTLKKQDKEGNIVADKKSLFGLRKDDEWILNAMYTDSSKIRDKLCSDLWTSFGASKTEFPKANFGTRMVYTEVFFNHEYWGLYLLAEPVDSKQLDLKEGEHSYKSVTPQNVPTEELLNQPEYGETLNGYKLKGRFDRVDRSTWEPLLRYLELRDLADDETFREQASELVDTEGALDIWMYLQAVLGIDNRGKNMYYVAKSTGTLQKLYFAPWDMDITWGDALSEGTDGNVWTIKLLPNLYSERINWSLGDRLVELDVDGAVSYVSERWKALREGVFSDAQLTEEIDSLIHQVRDSGALARNEERWPESNTGQDYGLFQRMALYRMGILDYYFEGHLEEYLGLGYE